MIAYCCVYVYVQIYNTGDVVAQVKMEVFGMIYLSVREAGAPDQLDKSPHWIRKGIELGMIEAQKIGRTFAIPKTEVERIKKNPFTISKKEMYG